MRARLGPLALLAALAACGPGEQRDDAASAAPADERSAIYAVLLDSTQHQARKWDRKHQYVQVEAAEYVPQAEDDDLPRDFPAITPALLAAFRAAATQPVDVRVLAHRPGVEWITRDSLGEVGGATSRDIIITRFSPVGLSADGRRGLVFVSYWCGIRCGTGEWVLLERQADGRWTFRQSRIAYIS